MATCGREPRQATEPSPTMLRVLLVNDTDKPIAELREAHEGFFPTLMGADAALA